MSASVRNLVVGDILCATWGYEQTNVDWYLVTDLVRKASVKLQQIGSKRVYDADPVTGVAGYCLPDRSVTKGNPFNKRAFGDRVKIESEVYAFKHEPSVKQFFTKW